MKQKQSIRFVLHIVTIILITVPTIYAKGKNGDLETPPENVVARVNGNEILRDNFERQVNIMQQQLVDQGQPLDENGIRAVQTDVLERLIDSELLFQESQKKGFTVDDEKLNERFCRE
jgi:hypothetical protein